MIEKFKNNCIKLSLVMIVIALSGCIMGDELYLTSKEQYAIGWILHDINDSTSTNLTYSLNDLAIYNYSYHYPSSMPDTYYNFFTLLSPVPNGMTEETIIFGNQLAVPLNRTYYTMGINPAQENYKTYWSFFNVMRINYLPDVDPYSYAHMEYFNSTRGYRAIKPETGDRSLVYFGKAPFTPTQILIENSSIKLKNYLVRGYHSDSYLWRNTGDFPDYLMPKYQIFLNGSLNSSGNLTDVNKIWNYTSLNYSLVENGTYTVNMTIPTSYEVLERIEIGATFYKPSDDMQPASLNSIEAEPYFEYNKSYRINLNITDDTGIKNVSCYYKDSSWNQLDVNNNSEIYETNFTIMNGSVAKIDFKISINDSYDNQINYTIYSLSLVANNVSLTLFISNDTIFKGGKISVSGRVLGIIPEVKGGGTVGLEGLFLDFFSNKTNIGSTMTEPYYDGDYSTLVKTDCNSDSNQNITVKFYGTGVYKDSMIFNTSTVTILPLNFTVNETVGLHSISTIKVNGYGAYMRINRSGWSYEDRLDYDTFYFIPHHYGNYTVTLNTSCGENVSKNVFSNITSAPTITGVSIQPIVPLYGNPISMSVSTYSQDNHILSGNISNETTTTPLNFTFSLYPSTDYYTGEIYNYSYCTNCWSCDVGTLPVGIYNISMKIQDVIGQINQFNRTIFVYKPMNLTFNITDHYGNPVSRTLKFGIDNDYEISDYTYNINGMKSVDLLPNSTIFNKSFHISIANITNSNEYQLVRFLNCSINPNMTGISEYIENRTEFSDKIIYAIYAFNVSWNYNTSFVKFAYENVSRFNMYNKSASSVYSCKSFDFDQKTCTLSWTFVNSSPYVSGSRVNVNAEIDDPQAFSFGEPQTTTTSSTTTTITTSTVVTTIATGGENITSSSSTTTSSTSTSSTTTIETGVTTTISELITCPFECCVDETGFENKACEPGKTCIEHECKSETKWVKMPSYVIYVPVVAVVAFSLVFYYLIKTKKLGLFSKPVIVKDELTELAEKIKDLKNNGYDVSSLEKEYELALKCKMNNLKEMTEFHTEELRKKFNEMTS